MTRTKSLSKYLLDDNSVAKKIIVVLGNGKVNTPTEIADKIGTTSQSVNNYLKDLKQDGFVEKLSKKGRKQPYDTTDKADRILEIDREISILKSEKRNIVEEADT